MPFIFSEAKQKRSMGNTLFSLKESISDAPEDLIIPAKIVENEAVNSK